MSAIGMPKNSLVAFFEQSIRSILEYCSPAFHFAISEKDNKRIERIRKRARRCIGPVERLDTSLHDRRAELCRRQFEKMKENESPLIPPLISTHKMSKRSSNERVPPLAKTDRYKRTFIPSVISLLNSTEH